MVCARGRCAQRGDAVCLVEPGWGQVLEMSVFLQGGFWRCGGVGWALECGFGLLLEEMLHG